MTNEERENIITTLFMMSSRMQQIAPDSEMSRVLAAAYKAIHKMAEDNARLELQAQKANRLLQELTRIHQQKMNAPKQPPSPYGPEWVVSLGGKT